MKLSSFLHFVAFDAETILLGRRAPIPGTVIVTDKCNLHYRHRSVNNTMVIIHPYQQIYREIQELYAMGVRILFFCGGETFLWEDGQRRLRDLVIEAKNIGLLIVSAVTNGTLPIDLPEADLIFLSLGGDRKHYNAIRGEAYDTTMNNIRNATTDNICFYMAINQTSKGCVRAVCQIARDTKNACAVSSSLHTPYPDTKELALFWEEKTGCCNIISRVVKEGAPVFSLKGTFPYLIENSFPTPRHQCAAMEHGKLYIRGRCIDISGLYEQCGYFFVAEYTLLFQGNLKITSEMLHTHLKYIQEEYGCCHKPDMYVVHQNYTAIYVRTRV